MAKPRLLTWTQGFPGPPGSARRIQIVLAKWFLGGLGIRSQTNTHTLEEQIVWWPCRIRCEGQTTLFLNTGGFVFGLGAPSVQKLTAGSLTTQDPGTERHCGN